MSVKPSRGRGRGRGIQQKNKSGKHNRSGSVGFSTSGMQPHAVTMPNQFAIPLAARIPQENPADVLWVNQHGERQQRQVIGDHVLIHQQLAAPPRAQEVLLLTDEIVSSMDPRDKYIKCISMFRYMFKNYAQDIRNELIDINFPYIVFHIGSMQLGQFEPRKLQMEVSELITEVMKINSKSHLVFSSLVPRPLDHLRSCNRCVSFNQALQSVTTQLRMDTQANCTYVDVYNEFLRSDGSILNEQHNFIEDIYLSEAGICVARAVWLRYLGYFPRKPSK